MPIIDSFRVKFNHTDRHLSYLPFAHIFERSILWLKLIIINKYGIKSCNIFKCWNLFI